MRKPGALDVMQALWAQAHALEAHSKWMQRHMGVTGPQRLLLRFLAAFPGSSAADAARWLSLNPGTVSRLVTGLERARLVSRVPDPGGGRRPKLALTRRGQAVTRDPEGTVEEAVGAALRDCSPAEAGAAIRFASRLTRNLHATRRRRTGR
ncbi:MAG TPA: MarR family winged helix-turn-helix transcriptional regulator [Anaeromyxobacteraceae bacterium]|nr:MarR family winged helix-turn-helix transcriptional regulator [Anaeromyxobacteraceae bacterium]